MRLVKHIPNALTLSNLLLGCISILFSMQMELVWAGGMIFLATLPDFLDGLVARMLKVTSNIGKDLDSLADMVSFGVAPAIMLYQLERYFNIGWISYLALLIPLFAALRLAKFNNDDRQTDVFLGLPTPSVALFIASWPFIVESNTLGLRVIMTHPVMFAILPIVLSILMVSEIKLLSLKFKSLDFKENVDRYILIIIALLLLAFLKFAAIPVVILVYIILSVIRNFAR